MNDILTVSPKPDDQEVPASPPTSDQTSGVKSWMFYEEMRADGFNPEDIDQCQRWLRLRDERDSAEAHKRVVDELQLLWSKAQAEHDPVVVLRLYFEFRRGTWVGFSAKELDDFDALRRDILAHLDNCGATHRQILDFVRGYEQTTSVFRVLGDLLNLAYQLGDSVGAKIECAQAFERLARHDPAMFPAHCKILHNTEKFAVTPGDFTALEAAWLAVPIDTVSAWTKAAMGRKFDAKQTVGQRIRACRKKAGEPGMTVSDFLAVAERATGESDSRAPGEQMRRAFGKAVTIAATDEDWRKIGASIESLTSLAGEGAMQNGFDAAEWAREFCSAGSQSDSIVYLRGREPLYKTTEQNLLLARRYARVTVPLQSEHVRRCWGRALRKTTGTMDHVLMAIASMQATWISRTRKGQFGKVFTRKAIGKARSVEEWHAVASACLFFGHHLSPATPALNPKNPTANK
jgi:hypothetical protein